MSTSLSYLITYRFVPETPSYLLYTNQEERAERSLRWLRGGSWSTRRSHLGSHSCWWSRERIRDRGEEEEVRSEEVPDVSEEMATIHSNIRRAKEEQRGAARCCRDTLVPRLLKPLALTCGLTFFHRFSGVAAFNFYAVTIFQEASASFNPHLAAVTVGAVQVRTYSILY